MPNINKSQVFAVTEGLRKIAGSKSIEPTDDAEKGIFASTPTPHKNLKAAGIAGNLLDTVDYNGKVWLLWELAESATPEAILKQAETMPRRASSGRYVIHTRSLVEITDREDNNRMVAHAIQSGQHQKVFVMDEDSEIEYMVHYGEMTVNAGKDNQRTVKARECNVNGKIVQAKTLRRLALKVYKAHYDIEDDSDEDEDDNEE